VEAVTLVLRPKGRGNWAAITVKVDGKRAESLFIRPGQLLPLGGVVFRIAKVLHP